MNTKYAMMIFAVAMFTLISGCCPSTQHARPELTAQPAPIPSPACKTPKAEPKLVRFEYEINLQFSEWMLQIIQQTDTHKEKDDFTEQLLKGVEFFVEVKGEAPYYERKVILTNKKLNCKNGKPCTLAVQLGKLGFTFVVSLNLKPIDVKELVEGHMAGKLAIYPYHLTSVKLAQADGTEDVRWEEQKGGQIKGALVAELK